MKMIEMMKKGIVLTLASVMVICSMPANIEAATGDVVELKLKDTLVNIQVNGWNHLSSADITHDYTAGSVDGCCSHSPMHGCHMIQLPSLDGETES